jgi:hypothetical protein
MRILLSKQSKLKLLDILKQSYKCRSLIELAQKTKISKKTLETWFYTNRYIPHSIIPDNIIQEIEILDKQEDNWGKVMGGKKTYLTIIKKYGFNEIKRRQSLGGINSKIKVNKINEDNFYIDLKDPLFLEFYGVLLGDGWLSNYKNNKKTYWLIGICGHSKLDRDFFFNLKKIIKELFNRNAYLKERPKYNAIELNFSHKNLLNYFKNELEFPIGKKIGLKISKKIYGLGYKKLKHVIRGIFDTDGCFYLDKTPAKKLYPCISIKMKSPTLIEQIKNILIEQGFRVIYKENCDGGQSKITLKGNKQISKWMKEIGSKNKRHLNKMLG